MAMSGEDITDDDIRELFNAKVEGTVTDALVRYDCQQALGEQVIGDDHHPEHKRYPTKHERRAARARCAKRIEERMKS